MSHEDLGGGDPGDGRPGRGAGWDGRDDAGQAVADGVYFVRLESRDGTSLRKVVRLR